MTTSSQPLDKETVEAKVILHLIHGTWSDGKGWVAKGTPFREFLEKKFGEAVRINPIGWEGHNRDADRREAKAKVVRAVQEAKPRGVRQFLIGHSHGGNVAAYAAADPEIAPLLQGVVCLSTPFLCAMPREFVWRAAILILCVCLGPLSLIGDTLLQAAFGHVNEFVRLAVSVLVTSLGLGAFVAILKPLAAKARKAAKRSDFARCDSVPVLALASGEDEPLSGLVLLDNLASVFRLLQHPIMVVLFGIGTLLLMATHVLPSPLASFGRTWAPSDTWTYATGYMLLCAVLETVISAVCRRLGLGLGWREFPLGSAFLVRVGLHPVPLNFNHVEFHCFELEGKSVLAHCRIYEDREVLATVASWIANRLGMEKDPAGATTDLEWSETYP